MSSLTRRVIFVVPLLLLPEIALSDTDWKTYAGASCKPGHRIENADYDAFGGVCNISLNQNLVVHCPVVRDFSVSRFPIFMRHSGRSGNPDVELRCTIRNMRRTANNSGAAMEAHRVELEPIPSGTSTTIRTRDADLGQFGLDAEDFGAHVLTCDLPASQFVSNGQQVLSCLYNYSVRESDGQ